MDFGSRIAGDSAEFAIWAPDSREMNLVIHTDSGGERVVGMTREEEGWFRVTVGGLGHGDIYHYELPSGLRVPDPASRFQPRDVHGPSMLIDPSRFEWRETEWRGRPFYESIIYELHVGTFSREGTYDGVRGKLDYLSELGVTAIELMPLSDFPGRFSWGYDGVLPFAPDSSYGTPDDLKRLIDDAHRRGISVYLDVVYNHFGPEGNYLHSYASPFFTRKYDTPWGDAVNFSEKWVREFVIQNAIYWLEEYRFDGLRFDAVHAIFDDSRKHILEELAERIRSSVGKERNVHLMLENGKNEAHFLEYDQDRRPKWYDAQWNDDIHHIIHTILTGESIGYYYGFSREKTRLLGRGLAEGFIFQGDPTAFELADTRGEPSSHLPPTAFINFLQNHDQVGNRPLGRRLIELTEKKTLLRALYAAVLLCPSIPMIFMGEERGSRQRFPFFCDFSEELKDSVREGRKEEFREFFVRPEYQGIGLPDPCALETVDRARLEWDDSDVEQREWFELSRRLLEIRKREIIPMIPNLVPGAVKYEVQGDVVRVNWEGKDGHSLEFVLNLGTETESLDHSPISVRRNGVIIWDLGSVGR